MKPPFFNNPLFSASSIISLAILSFMEPEGLKYSSFAQKFLPSRKILANGVFPISSKGELTN